MLNKWAIFEMIHKKYFKEMKFIYDNHLKILEEDFVIKSEVFRDLNVVECNVFLSKRKKHIKNFILNQDIISNKITLLLKYKIVDMSLMGVVFNNQGLTVFIKDGKFSIKIKDSQKTYEFDCDEDNFDINSDSMIYQLEDGGGREDPNLILFYHSHLKEKDYGV